MRFWAEDVSTGIHYQINSESTLTWHQARKSCQRQNAELLSITAICEQAYIGKLTKNFCLSFWIGLNTLNFNSGWQWVALDRSLQCRKRGSFRWTSGEIPLFTHWNTAMSEGNQKKSWFEAEEFCREIGRNLVTINSREDQILLRQLALTLFMVNFHFIGALLKPEPNYKCEYQATHDGWIIYEDKQYYFSKECVHIEEAQRICQKKFANLVAIENESERQFLWKYITSEVRVELYLIGLVFSFDKKFSWLDGTPVNYVAWASKESSFVNNAENCVIMSDFGFWKVVNCAEKNAFICEKQNTKYSGFAPTVLPSLGGCPETWHLFKNKCYEIFGSREEERLTWNSARSACIELGGNLACIQNEQVQVFFTFHLKDVANETWVRLDDISRVHIFGQMEEFFAITDSIAMIKESMREARYWKSADYQHNKSCICQMESKPELFHCATAPGSDFIHYDNSSYSIVISEMNEARKACQAKSSELASIFDYYSNTFLLLQAVQYGKPLWIRLNSKMSHGYYRRMDKRKINFSKWYCGEPKQKPVCVYLELSVAWKTAPCNEKASSCLQKI
ncbi:LOW QUALITY PROTEIN: macrophage mannose receptor 1-like [Guaruba guarouba]